MEYVILFFSALNLLFGLVVVLRPPYTRANISFFVFACVASFWTFNNFYLRLVPELEILRQAYALGPIVATAGLIWIRFFLEKPLNWYIKYFFIPVTVLISFPIIGTDYVVLALHDVSALGYEGSVGPLFGLYSSYIGIQIFLIIYNLLLAQRTTTSEALRKQVVVVLFGALFFSVTSLGVSLIAPTFFNTFNFTVLDNLSFSVFLFSIVFATLRYRLFNLKIVATEFFVAILWIFTLARALVEPQLQDKLIGGALFIITAVVGLLLIRSVIKEVESKEEIQRLYKELEVKNQKLTELDTLKSQFLSIATHELRTPLTIVRNFISLMLDGTYGKVAPAAEEAGRQVFERVTDMTRSVDTYLNVSRIEQGKISYNFTDTDFTHIVTLAVDGLRANAEKKKLSLTLAIKPGAEHLHGNYDAPKIAEVVTNLIDNSIKYTQTGSIAVTLEHIGTKARLTVSDTGDGMTEETMQNLFKLFSPGKDSKKINPASTGVGLYISRAHVEAHKGTLVAASEGQGKGSQFTLELLLN